MDKLCHCGTVEEAVKVGTALKTICVQHLAGSAGMTMREVQEAANHVVHTTKANMTPEADLAERGLEKGRALNGL